MGSIGRLSYLMREEYLDMILLDLLKSYRNMASPYQRVILVRVFVMFKYNMSIKESLDFTRR